MCDGDRIWKQWGQFRILWSDGYKRNVTWHVASYDSGYESISKSIKWVTGSSRLLCNGWLHHRTALHVDGSNGE
jgi:hypothetical protein